MSLFYPLQHKLSILGTAIVPAEVGQHRLHVHKLVLRFVTQIGIVTAPTILSRVANCLYSYRIQMDVATQFQQVAVLRAQDRLVPPLKKVAAQSMPAIEVLRITTG